MKNPDFIEWGHTRKTLSKSKSIRSVHTFFFLSGENENLLCIDVGSSETRNGSPKCRAHKKRSGVGVATETTAETPAGSPPVYLLFCFFMRKPAGLITRVRRKSVWSSQNTKICQSGLEKTKIKYIQAKSLIHLSCCVRRAHHSEPACSFASFSCQCVL